MQTRFRDLSWPCKVGVVSGWIFSIMYVLLFLFGFILGSLGY